MSEQLKEKELTDTEIPEHERGTNNKTKTISTKKYIILSIVFGLMFVLGVTLIAISIWYKNNYFLEFKELLYVLTGPLEGTGGSMISDILWATVPYATLSAILFVVGAILFFNKKKIFKKDIVLTWVRRVGCILCSCTLVFSLAFTAYAFRITTYSNAMRESTQIYEQYYVDPNSVSITANGKPKNLIYIYVESLENTHATLENGGYMDEDYMPNLTRLANENLSFSSRDEGQLGGFRSVVGSGWTIAALLATTSGIPYAFSVGSNDMDKVEKFAPKLTNLGDILEDNGYRQMFLCGSDASFAGRDKLYRQHGNYEIYDLGTARKNGDLPNPLYHNMWWGFEDKYLFEIAKKQATEMAADDKPFNLTMLTVDTHPKGGYVCDLCPNEFDNDTANVIKCTDKLVYEFVEWCKTQDFYKDTVIIITGDHPRHDNAMAENLDYGVRTMYNCFINTDTVPKSSTNNRNWTSLDVFPTTIAALGFTIEGDRLGLGVNVFSDQKTLAEELGYDELNAEMNKFSEFYLMTFAYNEKED